MINNDENCDFTIFDMIYYTISVDNVFMIKLGKQNFEETT